MDETIREVTNRVISQQAKLLDDFCAAYLVGIMKQKNITINETTIIETIKNIQLVENRSDPTRVTWYFIQKE